MTTDLEKLREEIVAAIDAEIGRQCRDEVDMPYASELHEGTAVLDGTFNIVKIADAVLSHPQIADLLRMKAIQVQR